ncbi:MAG: YmdB family metallophosphoesterase [Spirochaetes bacterium]|nr:YmdB family metallophosphoesterase [Spirochaetota bacterium]
MKILYIGEITGKSGVFCIKKLLSDLKKELAVDFTIAGSEGATGGFGIGKTHAVYLKKLGIDVLTTGEKAFFKKDMVDFIPKASFILRPANYPPNVPGRGYKIYQAGEHKIGVLTLLGVSGFTKIYLNNPFYYLHDIVDKLRKETNIIIFDFHAATTAEKKTMIHYAEGKVSAVIGSHSKVMTADEKILPGGTAAITDAGRTGSQTSVGGLEPCVEIKKFLSQIPERSRDCWDNLELQGVLIDVDPGTGKAISIERIKKSCVAEKEECMNEEL